MEPLLPGFRTGAEINWPKVFAGRFRATAILMGLRFTPALSFVAPNRTLNSPHCMKPSFILSALLLLLVGFSGFGCAAFEARQRMKMTPLQQLDRAYKKQGNQT